MRCSAGVTNTAKVSYENRLVLLDRIDGIIDGLRDLRQRAVQHASPQSIKDIAPEIDLPRPSSGEQGELYDTAKRDDFPWLVEDKIRERGIALLKILQGKTKMAEEVSFVAFDVEGTWFETVSDMAECESADPFEQLAIMFPDEANPFDCEGNAEVEDGDSDYDESFIFEDDISADKQSSSDGESWSGMSSFVQERRASNVEDHVLLTPWSQTFSFHLQEYLNQFEQGEDQEQTPQPPPGLDTTFDNVSHMIRVKDFAAKVAKAESEPECDGSNRGLLAFAKSPVPPEYPITTAHLLRLQKDIQHAYSFRLQLCKSLWDVRDSLNRREDRYRMRETNGDITMIMRSRGFGSPLVVGTTVDETKSEEEEHEESWGIPATSAPRKKIYGASLKIMGGTWGDDLDSQTCGTEPEVHW